MGTFLLANWEPFGGHDLGADFCPPTPLFRGSLLSFMAF